MNRRYRLLVWRIVSVVALLLGGVAFAPQPTYAATLTVTNSNDSGPGSLRQAILDANANGEADTITFADGVTTVTLTSAQLEISDDLTIDGGAGVTVERSSAGGTPDFRIFEITSGNVTLDSLTIRNGRIAGNNGGGILNSATLNVTNSTISGNEADDFGGGIATILGGEVNVTNSTISGNTATSFGGGGIFTDGGTVTVTDSTLSDNTATTGNGGGIFNDGGTMQINGSIFSSNDSGFNGGGIYSTGNLRVTTSTLIDNTTIRNGGGIYCDNMGTVTVLSSTLNRNTAGDFAGGIGQFNGELSIINSTITGNEATLGGGGVRSYVGNTMSVINSTINNNTISGTMLEGGGIRNEGPMTLYNTIVANSTGDVDVNNTGGTLNAASSTIVADGSLTAPGITDDDPQLGPLADNGGPTLTHLPQAGSPAIDMGDNTVATNAGLTTDQRGFARIVGGTVDIGAVEVGAGDIAYTISIDPTTVEEGDGGDTPTATVTVTRSGVISETSSVDVTLSGTATENTDYTFALAAGSAGSFDAGTGTLSFAANETEAALTITVQGDDIVEPDETVEVTLANPTAPESATLTTGAATLTITNDDTDDDGDGGNGGDDGDGDNAVYLPLIQQ